MSRYTIDAIDSTNTVAVGFDGPLGYFFATVFNASGDAIFDTDAFTGVASVFELHTALKPYANLSVAVAKLLYAESLGKSPTNAMRDMRSTK